MSREQRLHFRVKEHKEKVVEHKNTASKKCAANKKSNSHKTKSTKECKQPKAVE